MSQRPRLTPRLTVIRAGIGTHRLGAGPLAGSAVGKLTTEQLEDVKAYVELEVKRMAGLTDDAAVTKLRADLKAINTERERRWNNLVAS